MGTFGFGICFGFRVSDFGFAQVIGVRPVNDHDNSLRKYPEAEHDGRRMRAGEWCYASRKMLKFEGFFLALAEDDIPVNPKLESRNPKQIRISKASNPEPTGRRLCCWPQTRRATVEHDPVA